ncbi:GNAT family N-acetyltransferase [Lewinella sp. W8]|uniref:GNAT family N-acetyltransferase n=1 Tax=Lewinella sp. W8 TaxID=2528208 RepID=UPI001068210E|nr:GNAT family N-acetyltransferase [Lewinella sp. W8]MTB49688.1 GNAT family N-acetyltransferase [Lewinella sp. W8]
MKHRKLDVREGTIAEVVEVSQGIPELINPYPPEAYHQKLTGVPHLVLIATVDDQPAGFKVGYQREDYWYSWMGGVLPNFRRLGLARMLANAQDQWAGERGYTSVTFKTHNRHRGMLQFALTRGFNIIKVEPREVEEEYRIWLRRGLGGE